MIIMDISLQSLLLFAAMTAFYFMVPSIGKPRLLVSDLLSVNDYTSRMIKHLIMYMVVVVCGQFFLNIGYLMSTCGGALDHNIGAAALYTFVPWTLLMGVMMVVLVVFPGFKTAFSNVIGYFVVSSKATELFGQILMDATVRDQIDQTADPTKKQELTQAAETILKICGNQSILINQINPDNFLQMWDMLKSLMKPGIYESDEWKQQLLDVVTLKENVGEAMWYVYTSILISSIVYYQLATRGCTKSVEQIKADHERYIKSKEEADNQQTINQSTTYVMS